MKNTINSGETYTIKSLFNNDYRIVIPDMQREFCWATVKPENQDNTLIKLFVTDLINYAKNDNQTIQMGLLYAYESPKYDIQLCDGQQRITSLYLLLGYLYLIIKDDKLKSEIKKVLVTNDLLEPRLQYAIRETTLFFIKDLVENLFLKYELINDKDIIAFIKNQEWYFNEYNLDPTIQNMLLALKIIQDLVSSENADEVANFVLNKISFLYFDMETRTHGEEQFVVLNTTGKPLTKTENIKPKMLGDLDDVIKKNIYNNKTTLRYYSDMWENWEQYFWENRHKNHKTADKGLKEFFRWIYIIEQVNIKDAYSSIVDEYKSSQKAIAQADYSILELKENKIELMDLINLYFEDLLIIEKDNDVKKHYLFKEEQLSQIDIFKFLPLLVFIRKTKSIEVRNFKRLKYFFSNKAKFDNVRKASLVTSVEAIRITKLLNINKSQDIAYFAITNKLSITIFDELEIFKFKAYLNAENREKLEEAIWETENLKTTNGNIRFILDVIETITNNNKIDLNLLKKTTKIVRNTFEMHSDLMRRCLLIYGDYTKHDGSTPILGAIRYSFGNSPSFYGSIANYDDLKKTFLINFISELLKENLLNRDEIDEWMKQKIEIFTPLADADIWRKMRNIFIKKRNLMREMNKKLFCVTEDENELYLLYNIRGTSYKKII